MLGRVERLHPRDVESSPGRRWRGRSHDRDDVRGGDPGIGALGAVFQQRLQSVLTAEVARRHLPVPPSAVKLAARGGLHTAAVTVPTAARAGFVAAGRVASTSALHGVVLVGGIAAIAVGIVIAFLRD